MSVNINTATVDAIVSVWAKLPEEVRYKVIEATNRLLTISKRFSKDTTDTEVSGMINGLYDNLPADVQQGVLETFRVIARNYNI